MDWQSAIKGFQAYLKLEKGLSANSIEAYSRDIDKLYQYADIQNDKLKPESITLADLRLFIGWVNELGMIPSSQARVLSGVKSFYKYLLIEDIIKTDPSELLESPKKQRKLPDTLSIEDINNLIGVIDLSKPEGPRNKAMIEVLYSCGLRVSELTGLKLSNLYLDIEFIKVTGKGSKERLVPIGGEAIKALKIWIENVRVHVPVKKGEDDMGFPEQEGIKVKPGIYFYADKAVGPNGGDKKNDKPPYLAAFVCYAPGGGRCRLTCRTGNAGARKYYHNGDIYPFGQGVLKGSY